MWNQSKRILYILLFIYVLQVILSFVDRGIYVNNTHLSGMSQAKLQAKLEPQMWPFVSYQSLLSKLLVLLFAIFHLTIPHCN